MPSNFLIEFRFKKISNLFEPPPLYRDLERQIDLLRAENAKLKSKLYGSKTDLDKIKVESQSRDSSPVKAGLAFSRLKSWYKSFLSK